MWPTPQPGRRGYSVAMLPLHRPYRDEADLSRLLGWLSAHAHRGYMHPGDLVWWLRQNTQVDPTQALELFLDGAGEVQGFVFSDPVTWAVMQGAPGTPAPVWDAMLAVAAAKAGPDPLTVQPHEHDAAQLAALTRGGFAPAGDRQLQLVRVPERADLEPVALPGGLRFTDMGRGDVPARVRVGLHQEVWRPSRVTPEAYARLQAAPLYRPDLDVLVVDPTGAPVAYALGWFDPGSRTGLIEPVGTHPAFRRRGLGAAVVREVTRRVAALGAGRVTIGTSAGNAAAVALYRAAGYHVGGAWAGYQAGPGLSPGAGH